MNYHGVQISRDKIAEFCRRWKIIELALFGSILRDDFRPESDIDVLVTFAPSVRWKLDDLLAMREELGAMFGHPVDIVERRLVEQSPNYIRRKHILSCTETLYGRDAAWVLDMVQAAQRALEHARSLAEAQFMARMIGQIPGSAGKPWDDIEREYPLLRQE